MTAKRILVVVLWGYAFWYLGAMLSAFALLPAVAGPALGIAGAAFAAYRFAGLRPVLRTGTSRVSSPASQIAPRRPA